MDGGLRMLVTTLWLRGRGRDRGNIDLEVFIGLVRF
jgi:hypothetical protein